MYYSDKMKKAMMCLMSMMVAVFAVMVLGTIETYAQGINYPVGSPGATSGTGNARVDADNYFMRNNVAGLTEIPVSEEEENSQQLQESGKGGWRAFNEIQESIYLYRRDRTAIADPNFGKSSRAVIINPGVAGELTYTSGNHKFGFGIGAYQAFGFQSKFEEDPKKFGARSTFFDTRVASNDVAVGSAFRLTKQISVGAAFIFGRAFLDLKTPALQAFAFGLVRDSRLDVSDIGAPGVNVGVHIRPSEKLDIGISYKSRRTYNLEGKFETFELVGFQFAPNKRNAEVEFKLPAVAEVGIVLKPSKKLHVALDYRFYDYTATFGPPIVLVDKDTKQRLQTINIGGKDVRSYRAGLIINKSEKTKIFFGGAYTTNGFPEAAINPGLVNVGGADFSLGLARKVGERWFNFAIAAIQGRERKVGPPANRLFGGKYIGGGVLFSLGLRLTKVPILSK
ncbi:MAG: hypothetical protein FD167_1526 [bacterium]|nr:MAG: hypothetical protein FD167_1526 [bacterium]